MIRISLARELLVFSFMAEKEAWRRWLLNFRGIVSGEDFSVLEKSGSVPMLGNVAYVDCYNA